MSTYDVEKTDSTDLRGNLLFIKKLLTVSRKTETMPKGNAGNRKSTIYYSTHLQG